MNLEKKIGLGTVQFGMRYGISNQNGQTVEGEVCRILSLAQKSGINLLDTAFAYGESERVLGKMGAGFFQVVTKFKEASNGQHLRTLLTESKERLCVKILYGFLAHDPSVVLNNPALWEELLSIQAEGVTKHIGFSLYSPKELDALLESGFVPSLVQIPFSYLDNRFAPYLSQLRAYGCEVHTRSTFMQGLFFMKPQMLSSYFDPVKPLLSYLQQQFPTDILAAALLNHVVKNPLINRVIIGVENSEQLSQLLDGFALAVELPNKAFDVPEDLLIPSFWPRNLPSG